MERLLSMLGNRRASGRIATGDVIVNALFRGIETNDMASVQEMLEVTASGGDAGVVKWLTTFSGEGHTALHLALATSSIEMVSYIIHWYTRVHKDGLNQLSGDARRQPPLVVALARNDPGIFSDLLSQGADPNVRDGNGRTILYLSCCVGAHALVEQLLKTEGIQVNLQNKDSEQQTALLAAVVKGDKKMASILLSHGADPNIHCGPNSETALMIAVQDHDDLELVRLLLENKANPLALCDEDNGLSVMDMAVVLDKNEIYELLQSFAPKRSESSSFIVVDDEDD
eukprot:TRINITY_DN4339_c0_g2_i1.p1 TRINITY_DN4339_c0_g2~~TRINITY_DN4339_c0_g2_i1.p1  ORF type:complete len:296 (+),score=121.79 TRINITY_DN4339_c0_g2_i1:34-888(+)